MAKNILITGGAGFIGSHVVRLFANKYPNYNIINLDKLTYAGVIENLEDVAQLPNYTFIKGDICDMGLIKRVFIDHQITDVIHLAAESHVDRSISDPLLFARTNVMGTLSLLEVARASWAETEYNNRRFYHISTDEVYGALGLDDPLFTEYHRYDPHSPYSASKASADHFVRSYYDTYGLPCLLSCCSNNYGPYQFPEKLIPVVINNIRDRKPIPIYGRGDNIRDWLYVEDHARAIDLILHRGRVGESYNIGGVNEWSNLDVVRLLISVADRKLGRRVGESESLISFVTDRAGHDFRYAIDCSKLTSELGWNPVLRFEEGIEKTVDWYLSNRLT